MSMRWRYESWWYLENTKLSSMVWTYANEETFHYDSGFKFRIEFCPSSVDNKPNEWVSIFSSYSLLCTVTLGVALLFSMMMGCVSEDWHAMLRPTVIVRGWRGFVSLVEILSTSWRVISSLIQLLLSWLHRSSHSWSTCTTFEDPSGFN